MKALNFRSRRFARIGLLALLAAEVALGARIAYAALTTYTCNEGRYVFNGYNYNGSGQIVSCNLIWSPDNATIPGPYSSCAPNGTLHYVQATQGWNAFRSICYGAITQNTSGPTSDHLTGVP
jgi:hypothetical protein